jgi:histidinol-phosphate aminotransferase
MSDAVDRLIESLVRDDVRAASAYHVPDARGLIKLDAMENPYAWPEAMYAELGQRLRGASINRYPDPHAQGLKRELRRAMGIDARWEILLGNGSDEIIQMLIAAVAGTGCSVLAPAPSFVMYRVLAGLFSARFEEVTLGEDFDLDPDATRRAIERNRPQLVFLACPNNPTGNVFSAEALRAVLEAATGLVVIDEAYGPFTAADHLALLEDYPNLLVMRTLSKLGLAGLRLGYLVGDPRWIAEIDKVRLPYNIGVLTQIAGELALENFDVLVEQTQWIRAERERIFGLIDREPRLRCWPSEANFLLVRTPPGTARAIHAAMRDAGVLVKCLDGSHALLADCLRLTVGTREENEAMLSALGAALEHGAAGRD